jgi:hypothetical protein
MIFGVMENDPVLFCRSLPDWIAEVQAIAKKFDVDKLNIPFSKDYINDAKLYLVLEE